MSGRPAGIPLPDKGLSDPEDGQTRAPRNKGLAGVPPPRRRFTAPKGYNMYVTSLYQDEDYALRHMDCGQPPDGRVFVSGVRTTDDLPPWRDKIGERLQQSYLDDDSEAWSPPDTLLEED